VYILAKYINESKIYFSSNDDILRTKIIEELEQIKAKNIDTDGKLQVINKDEIKRNINRSPDYLDVFTMRMYFELNDTNSVRSLNDKYEQLFMTDEQIVESKNKEQII
jgi:hypothetical protein